MKIVKYKYTHNSGKLGNNNVTLLNPGYCGLISKTTGYVQEKQIKAIVDIFSKFKKKESIFIKIILNKVQSKKNIGSRMGGGKGDTNFYYCRVPVNRLLLEFKSNNKEDDRYLLKIISSKLSFKTKVILA